MTRSPEHNKQLDAWLETAGAAMADTIQHNPRATIAPPLRHCTAAQRAVEVLGDLAGHESTLQINVHKTLGQGGMGIIREAEQVALRRMVAVKSLRPDRQSDEATLALLREAWITGSLEHPNVVPVHDIGKSGEGSPIIILKRIEGVAWAELMNDPDTVRERFGTTDLLAWNLDIFLQVVNAVRFTHSRGIIHRDLKPDNVMIGPFGEVYVLDWGIAVSLREDPGGLLPLASDATEMAGTPCYMAPEMLGQSTEPLSERTDIYLLGAILYEIIAGRPPHMGQSAAAIIAQVLESNPPMPENAPESLAAICRRAMAAAPQDRYARADELRLAVQEFLQHQGSMRLARGAERDLCKLRDHLAAPALDDPEWHQRLYRLFGACRFGFQEALATWSENTAACRGLDQALVLMIEHELSNDEAHAAAAHLAELKNPPAELAARVQAALETHKNDRERIARLEKLGADMDSNTGARTRIFIATLLGTLWVIIPLVGVTASYLGLRDNRLSYSMLSTWTGIFLALIVALGIWARESMSKTAINRRMLASFIFLLLSQLPLLLGTWLMGVPAVTAAALQIFLWFTIAGMLAIHIDLRILPAALGYLLAFVVAARWPHTTLYAMGLSNMALLANARAMWRRVRHLYPDPPPKPRWLTYLRQAHRRK